MGDSVVFINIFKQRVNDNFIQKWNARSILYRALNDFGYKSYLSSFNIKKFRFVLTRLRVVSHRFEIESGRWKHLATPFNERRRKLCNKHFII